MGPANAGQSCVPAGRLRAAGWLWRVALLWFCLVAGAASAAGDSSQPAELPALVGRLSALQGDVRWLDREGGGWVDSGAAQPLRNWPVAAGDRLRTGADARADLRIGSLTLRLGADTELWLQQLDERAVLLQLQSGSIALRLPAIDGDAFGPVTLRTQEGLFLPQRPGAYRIDRLSDATQASTWQGELRFEGHDSQLVVPAGRRADLWLDTADSAMPGRTRVAWAAVEHDAFADWVAREQRGDDAPISAAHVPPGMTGWQDLDRHGDWITDPELGSLWQPRAVAAGWAPYQVGRWAWVAPWGWTWIDAAPWGFAPFHYGAWVVVGGRWSWSPGPRGYRPRYVPAHSAWLAGPGVGVGMPRAGWRPPPPVVVMPVVVPVVVHRPGRAVVVVNAPLQRPGYGGLPAPAMRPDGWQRDPRWAEPRPRPYRDGDRRDSAPRVADPSVAEPRVVDPQLPAARTIESRTARPGYPGAQIANPRDAGLRPGERHGAEGQGQGQGQGRLPPPHAAVITTTAPAANPGLPGSMTPHAPAAPGQPLAPRAPAVPVGTPAQPGFVAVPVVVAPAVNPRGNDAAPKPGPRSVDKPTQATQPSAPRNSTATQMADDGRNPDPPRSGGQAGRMMAPK